MLLWSQRSLVQLLYEQLYADWTGSNVGRRAGNTGYRTSTTWPDLGTGLGFVVNLFLCMAVWKEAKWVGGGGRFIGSINNLINQILEINLQLIWLCCFWKLCLNQASDWSCDKWRGRPLIASSHACDSWKQSPPSCLGLAVQLDSRWPRPIRHLMKSGVSRCNIAKWVANLFPVFDLSNYSYYVSTG